MCAKKMLVLDIDGTLTNSKKEITKPTKEAIDRIREQGHIIVIASGRPTAGIIKVANELEMDKKGGYVLSFNGARITDWKTNKVIYQNTLDKDIIDGLYDYAKDNDLGLVTYEEKNVVTATRHDEYMELESKICEIPIKDVADFSSYVDFDVNKCLLTSTVDIAKQHEEKISGIFPEATVCRSEPFFIEVMPSGVDKATSLDKLVSKLGLTREDTICCGDGFNDISMIDYAGVGVAMENAQDEVKEKANYITSSNDDDGIVQVINKFF